MAMAVVPRSSSSSFVASSSTMPSSAQSDCSSSEEGLWRDVDLAERCLVSSQFNEAAESSSSLLRKLVVVWESSHHGMHNSINDNEMEGIMEATGMVLIQAYNESSRTGSIFKDLETLFGCTAKVPSSVLLAGLCLQISAGLHLEAQLFVESFLEHWAYTASNHEFCTFKPKLGHNHKYFRLTIERYIEIVELYCIQVLAKGLRRLDFALQMVQDSDIPAERKQDMQEKLKKVGSSLGRKEETLSAGFCDKVMSSIPDSREYLSGPQFLECVEAKSRTGVSKQAVEELDAHSSLKNVFVLSPLMDILSRWMNRSSVLYSDRVSSYKTALKVVYQNKLSFGGAVGVFLMIAIYRQRLRLSRLSGGLGKALHHVLHAIFISLYDFWQLAFNVQLNPLAAVQPLPPTHHGR